MTSLSRGRILLKIVMLVGLIGAAPFCWAHAILLESSPQLNGSVTGPDVAIDLRFNVRIDGERSRLRLVTAAGQVVALATVKQSSPDHLQTRATGVKSGAYRLQWQVLASDGHMSRGEIPFTVTDSKSQ